MNQSESESSAITTTTTTTSAATINAQDNENANASSGGESQLVETRDRQSPIESTRSKNKNSKEETLQQTISIAKDNINDIENNNIAKQIQTLLDSTERTLNKEQATTASSTTTTVATTTSTNISDKTKINNTNNSYNYITLANQAAQVVADAASQLKILAPAMTRDMTLPNTGKKVPMVMVPVPETGHLIAIPLATINQLKDSDQTMMGNVSKDEEQARDLLNWEDGVGTLEGCDLRFKINDLGKLELIDSDDESENKKHDRRQYHANNNIQQQQQQLSKQNKQQAVNNKKQASNNAISASSQSSSSDHTRFHPKRARLDQESTPSIKQISPGSSLLRDGPDIRRPKSSTTAAATTNSLVRNNQLTPNNNQTNNTIPLLKKVDTQSLNLLLAEKIVPKQKLDEMRSKVDEWTIEDVCNFIDSIPGCDGYGELFKKQLICGKSLMYLDQRDLLDIIDLKLGPAVKIYHAISLLKS